MWLEKTLACHPSPFITFSVVNEINFERISHTKQPRRIIPHPHCFVFLLNVHLGASDERMFDSSIRASSYNKSDVLMVFHSFISSVRNKKSQKTSQSCLRKRQWQTHKRHGIRHQTISQPKILRKSPNNWSVFYPGSK